MSLDMRKALEWPTDWLTVTTGQNQSKEYLSVESYVPGSTTPIYIWSDWPPNAGEKGQKGDEGHDGRRGKTGPKGPPGNMPLNLVLM